MTLGVDEARQNSRPILPKAKSIKTLVLLITFEPKNTKNINIKIQTKCKDTYL